MSVHHPGELDALRDLLDEWAERNDRVIAVGPDRGLDHGRLCWRALEPTGLLHPHCAHCRRHGGPRDDRELHRRLHVRVPAADAADVVGQALWRNLVFPSLGVGRDAEVLAGPLVELLGPDADWRTNADPWRSGSGWRPVTEATFDLAVVGVGNGYGAVLVNTGED